MRTTTWTRPATAHLSCKKELKLIKQYNTPPEPVVFMQGNTSTPFN